MHELMVTNYAGYRVRTEYGDLKVENLFTGSLDSATHHRIRGFARFAVADVVGENDVELREYGQR